MFERLEVINLLFVNVQSNFRNFGNNELSQRNFMKSIEQIMSSIYSALYILSYILMQLKKIILFCDKCKDFLLTFVFRVNILSILVEMKHETMKNI